MKTNRRGLTARLTLPPRGVSEEKLILRCCATKRTTISIILCWRAKNCPGAAVDLCDKWPVVNDQWPEGSDPWPLITDHLSQHLICIANHNTGVLVAAVPLQEYQRECASWHPTPNPYFHGSIYA